MPPRQSYPPTFAHPSLTTVLEPSAAQKHIATFITASQSRSHFHPDSTLSNAGVTFSAHSGPNGGLALHHLRRIDAGLRGENLVRESEEELAQFAEESKDRAGNGLGKGDDTRVDGVIKKHERKRKREAIEEWAEESSVAGGGDGNADEVESLAARTPVRADEWQEQEDYEKAQHPLEGEIGDRDGAPLVHQNGPVPEVVEQGEDEEEGDEEEKKKVDKGKSKEDKAARKAAKRARKMAERREKAGTAG